MFNTLGAIPILVKVSKLLSLYRELLSDSITIQASWPRHVSSVELRFENTVNSDHVELRIEYLISESNSGSELRSSRICISLEKTFFFAHFP